MFQVGQKVVYGIHGVCDIIDIELKTVDRRKSTYYVLEPLEQPGTRYYIPKENPNAVAKLKPLLTRQELDELLLSSRGGESPWIGDENQRKQRYRQLIGGGDRCALFAMVTALHKHKAEQLRQGRKFHLCDENFLRDAEKLLSAEFSLILDISPAEVKSYITDLLENN